MTNKSNAVSFRLDPDLQSTVNQWLNKHPGINMSRLANLAIRSYVSNDQVLEAVETVKASDKKVKNLTQKMMKKHAHMLEKLK